MCDTYIYVEFMDDDLLNFCIGAEAEGTRNEASCNDPENLNQFKNFKLAKIMDFKYLK